MSLISNQEWPERLNLSVPGTCGVPVFAFIAPAPSSNIKAFAQARLWVCSALSPSYCLRASRGPPLTITALRFPTPGAALGK